jgi:uncharacterized protein (DUF362 family)
VKTIQLDLDKILKETINEAGLKNKRVFIKPNISHPEFIPGVVTDPALLSKIVGLLRDNNSEVLVGESNGYNYSCQCAFKKTGLRNAVLKSGGSFINLSEDKVIKINFRNNSDSPKKLFLPKSVLEADEIVDLALMKTHEFTTYSGAIKNLFGCIPNNRRIFFHPFLNEVLLKLYFLLNPKLTIIDARVGLEGNGPTKGDQVKMDLILTSNSALAIDIIASEIMGLTLNQVGHLHYIAKKRNFERNHIITQGIDPKIVTKKFRLPRIDLPVKAQMKIYQHEFLTKILFCSLDVVKIFQKITLAYRGKPIEVN